MARSTRKKKRTPATWQKKKLKGMVTQGRAHISSSGSKKLIRAKIVKPGCTASCRLGCGYKLTDEVKEELHKTFYQLPTRDHRQSFIVSSVSKAASLEVSQPLKTLVKHSHGSMQPVKVLTDHALSVARGQIWQMQSCRGSTKVPTRSIWQRRLI